MHNENVSAFTEKYQKIQNRLLNRVVLCSNGIIDQALAQWDTGATNTCISEEIVDKYNLVPLAMTKSRTPSGILETSIYNIDIVINNEVMFQNWNVIGSKIGAQGIDILIGMDVITKGDFAISNYNGKTQFSFRLPSQKDVDYKDEDIKDEDIPL
nr:MAG TPA: retropepsin-like protein [Bacteriophage sp.]